jgi:hypothetical protein
MKSWYQERDIPMEMIAGPTKQTCIQIWWCTFRNKEIICAASVSQDGEIFLGGLNLKKLYQTQVPW